MSLGEQKEQEGGGGDQGHRAGGGSNANWVGTVAGDNVPICWFFLLKQKKKEGGASHTEANDCFVCGFNQRPSLASASGEHSVNGVLQNTLAFNINRGVFFPFPLPIFFSPRPMLLHFPDRLVSCSRSTLAPCPRRGPSGTGGAKGFEARHGNTGTLRAVSCWGGTGCQFEVHTAGRWVGEKRRFGAETCYGCLLFGGRYGWPRC